MPGARYAYEASAARLSPRLHVNYTPALSPPPTRPARAVPKCRRQAMQRGGKARRRLSKVAFVYSAQQSASLLALVSGYCWRRVCCVWQRAR